MRLQLSFFSTVFTDRDEIAALSNSEEWLPRVRFLIQQDIYNFFHGGQL
jgi:hypothetical protein